MVTFVYFSQSFFYLPFLFFFSQTVFPWASVCFLRTHILHFAITAVSVKLLIIKSNYNSFLRLNWAGFELKLPFFYHLTRIILDLSLKSCIFQFTGFYSPINKQTSSSVCIILYLLLTEDNISIDCQNMASFAWHQRNIKSFCCQSCDFQNHTLAYLLLITFNFRAC